MPRFFRNEILVHHLHLGLFLFNTLLKARYQLINSYIELRTVFGRAGDNQGRSCLVDKNRVNLIDNCEVKLLLHLVFEAKCHVVA